MKVIYLLDFYSVPLFYLRFEWLMQNPMDNSVDIFRGTKIYNTERNLEIFDLIEKGSSISKGEIFEYFSQLVS